MISVEIPNRDGTYSVVVLHTVSPARLARQIRRTSGVLYRYSGEHSAHLYGRSVHAYNVACTVDKGVAS